MLSREWKYRVTVSVLALVAYAIVNAVLMVFGLPLLTQLLISAAVSLFAVFIAARLIRRRLPQRHSA